MAPTGPPTMKVPLSEGKRQRPCRREGRTSNPRKTANAREKLLAPEKFLSCPPIRSISHSAVSPTHSPVAFTLDPLLLWQMVRLRCRETLCSLGLHCKALMGASLFSVMLTNRLGRSPSTTFNCGPCAESSLRCSVGLSTSHGAKDRSPGFFGRGNRVEIYVVSARLLGHS